VVTILEAVALVLEKEEGVFVDYDYKMDIRQAGGTHRPAVTVAGTADSGNTGESKDAGRASVLCAEESGKRW